MANTVIALKKSATPSSVPSNLANGELAINYADGKLYYKAANGTIASISGNEPNYFGTVNANNTLVVADTPGDIFTIAAGKNIDIAGDAVNDKLTISLTDDVAVPGLLSVTASSGDEGGEIRLANAVTNSLLAGPVNIDIYQNQLRFFVSGGDARGAFINLASTSAGVGTDLLAASSGTDAYARTTANQAFDKANAALPNVSGAWFNGTLTASQNLVADKIISTNNGNGENFKIGDDVWIGDFNVANSLRIKGQQNASIAYINFGIDDAKTLGRSGTGPLTYDGNTVWHAGNHGTGTGLDADLLDGQHGSYYGIASDVTGAFTQANTARTHANAAFLAANNAVTDFSPAFNQANIAYAHANAAFITANIAFANSNTVMISTQAAFTVANSGFLHANASYTFANVIAITANLAFAHANAAFANGNTVIQTAQSAFNQANLAFIHANNAFASANAGQASGNAGQATANASYAFANSAHSIANLAFTYANNAYAKANTANITADLAFAHANAAFFSSNSLNTYTNSTYVKLSASSQTITGDLDIVGTLTLSGNTVFIDATRLEVDDPLLYLAANNYTSDIVDIGFIANYVNATGQNVHTGLYREHTDKEYYLFQGYDKEPINNHIGALSNNMTLAVLNADIKTSNLILGGVNAIATIGASFNHANAAFASANAGQATANASYAFSNSAHSIANLAFTHANNAYDQANNALANVTTRATYSGNLDFTAGGISFGSRVSSASTNVMNHIALWGTSFGFSITNQNLNAVVPATANVTILVGSTQRARVNSTGMWVTGGINASSMIKSAGLYDSSDRQLLIKDSTGTVVWGN